MTQNELETDLAAAREQIQQLEQAQRQIAQTLAAARGVATYLTTKLEQTAPRIAGAEANQDDNGERNE